MAGLAWLSLLAAGTMALRVPIEVQKHHHHTPDPSDGPSPGPSPSPPGPKPTPSPVPPAPQYASSYEVALTYSLPYVSQVQPMPLDMPIKAWTDATTNRQRIEYYGGQDVFLWQYDVQKVFQVTPHRDRVVCDAFEASGPEVAAESTEPLPPLSRSASLLSIASHAARTPAVGAAFGPHLRAARVALAQHLARAGPERRSSLAAFLAARDGDDSPLLPLLPDVSGWEYQGTDVKAQEKAHVWYTEDRELDKVNQYWFYASAERNTADGQPVPLLLRMLGSNFEFGSHFDEYLFTYHAYKPSVDADALERPSECVDPALTRRAGDVPRGALGTARQLARIAPRAPHLRGLSAAYDAHALAHGRRHSGREEYALRAAVFEGVAGLVRAHNADPRAGYTMAVNKWADWTEEEFRRVMLLQPGRSAPDQPTAAKPSPVSPGSHPGTVDWRGTGAVAAVKDQASCGSCWSFSAAGAVEGALFVAQGIPVSVSEQNLVDCSWDFEHRYGPQGSEGCDGGWSALALAYVQDKGVYPESAYPYIGQNGFCRVSPALGSATPDPVNGPTFTVSQVVPGPHFDPLSLKAAIYRAGPVSVSIQADVPSFRFYSKGVYNDPDCHSDFAYLDHAVLAVGYATEEAADRGTPGRSYFVIKNSWSPHWGDDGFIKIAEEGNVCGVASDWVYAVAAATPTAVAA